MWCIPNFKYSSYYRILVLSAIVNLLKSFTKFLTFRAAIKTRKRYSYLFIQSVSIIFMFLLLSFLLLLLCLSRKTQRAPHARFPSSCVVYFNPPCSLHRIDSQLPSATWQPSPWQVRTGTVRRTSLKTERVFECCIQLYSSVYNLGGGKDS